MKLPAHLSKCFFALEFFASFVKVLKFDTIFILILIFSKLFELILNGDFFITAYCMDFTKHSTISEDFKCESNTYLTIKMIIYITFAN